MPSYFDHRSKWAPGELPNVILPPRVVHACFFLVVLIWKMGCGTSLFVSSTHKLTIVEPDNPLSDVVGDNEQATATTTTTTTTTNDTNKVCTYTTPSLFIPIIFELFHEG